MNLPVHKLCACQQHTTVNHLFSQADKGLICHRLTNGCLLFEARCWLCKHPAALSDGTLVNWVAAVVMSCVRWP